MTDCCFAGKFRDKNNRNFVSRELWDGALMQGAERKPWNFPPAPGQAGEAAGSRMQRGGSLLAQVALVLALSVSGLALNSHRAAATDYTTTQTNTNLADGDTVTVTGRDGDGLQSTAGGTVTAAGNNRIQTNGDRAYGMYAKNTGSVVIANNVTVTTLNTQSHAAAAYVGTMTVNGGTFTLSGNNSYGGWASTGGVVNLTNVTINSGSATGGVEH